MGSKKKARTWEDIDPAIQDEIQELRKKEIEYKEKSGYNKWFKYFSIGSISYSALYYQFYFKRKSPLVLNVGVFFQLFSPILIYGYTLMKILYDNEAFKEYYLTHLELNRVIKKSSQSQHYK
jgi:hypothetical protein